MADQPSREQLNQVYDKVVRTYGNRPNVTGVDVGFRYEGTKRTNQMAVRVHVKEKIPKEALEADEVLPQQIDGVPIDVIQAVYKPHADAGPEPDAVGRKDRLDVVQPGVSVSHPNVTSGTLGAIVYDRKSGRQGILSNWHVFVGSLSVVAGAPVVQPGRKYGGRMPDDRIAVLERFLLDRHGDAALALLTRDRDASDKQFDSNVRVTEARQVNVGEIVQKSGVSTNVTSGIVDGVGQYSIDYPVGTKTIAGFKVVSIKPGNPDNEEISAGGDSGSLWYATDDKKGVGLHFAGETDPDPAEENALACHLPDVLEQLDVTLKPEGPVVPPPDEDVQAADALLRRAGGSVDGPDPALMIETIARLSRLLEQALSSSDRGPTPRANHTRKPTARARAKSARR